MERALLRPLTRDDLPSIERLLAGRNSRLAEYERFLAFEGAHGIAFEVDGVVVGVVTAIRYFEHAFVGPVLLLPEAEGPGSVIALFSRIVEGLQRGGAVFIDAEATDSERQVLEAMGFRVVRGTLVMERDATGKGAASRTREMHVADLLDVGALDAHAAGYGRKEFIAALRDELPSSARVLGEGDVKGFALARRSRRGYQAGPLVTRSTDAGEAEALLMDALAPLDGRPIVALVPEDGKLVEALGRMGFRQVGRLTRMRAGKGGPATEATEWLVGSRLTG